MSTLLWFNNLFLDRSVIIFLFSHTNTYTFDISTVKDKHKNRGGIKIQIEGTGKNDLCRYALVIYVQYTFEGSRKINPGKQ